jgi:hypothetical protein
MARPEPDRGPILCGAPRDKTNAQIRPAETPPPFGEVEGIRLRPTGGLFRDHLRVGAGVCVGARHRWGDGIERLWTYGSDDVATYPAFFPHVELEAWVAMPNHVHGIIAIVDDVRGRGEAFPSEGHDDGSVLGEEEPSETRAVFAECLAPTGTPRPTGPSWATSKLIRSEILCRGTIAATIGLSGRDDAIAADSSMVWR